MDKRTCDILDAAISGFIRTGEPVSSGWLFNNFDFGIKPAMIRLELNDLTDLGFLEQTHHSSGRIPTDKGYEFFAERVMDRCLEAPEPGIRLRSILEDREWNLLSDLISNELGTLSVVRELAGDAIYKEGLDELFDNLEWETRDQIREIIRDFEEIDLRLERIARAIDDDDGPRFFIGRKSPVTRSDSLSVILGGFGEGEGKFLLCAIGPKRMDYSKAARLFLGLKKMEEQVENETNKRYGGGK